MLSTHKLKNIIKHIYTAFFCNILQNCIKLYKTVIFCVFLKITVMHGCVMPCDILRFVVTTWQAFWGSDLLKPTHLLTNIPSLSCRTHVPIVLPHVAPDFVQVLFQTSGALILYKHVCSHKLPQACENDEAHHDKGQTSFLPSSWDCSSVWWNRKYLNVFIYFWIYLNIFDVI